MSVIANYGFTKAQYDRNLFYNKRKFDIVWEGVLNIDNSPDVNGYLRIDGKYQGLYVPELTFCHVSMQVLMFDAAGLVIGDMLGQGLITRASGGNATYTQITANTTGTVGGGGLTVVPTANTTVQAIEMIVSDSNSEQITYTLVRMRGLCANTLATGSNQIPAAASATLTVAE
jgi:hypothetical protein